MCGKSQVVMDRELVGMEQEAKRQGVAAQDKTAQTSQAPSELELLLGGSSTAERKEIAKVLLLEIVHEIVQDHREKGHAGLRAAATIFSALPLTGTTDRVAFDFAVDRAADQFLSELEVELKELREASGLSTEVYSGFSGN